MKANDYKSGLDLKWLRLVLRYEPQTGHFYWLVNRMGGNAYAGKRAGSVTLGGYRTIHIGKRAYWEHRLAWFYHYGTWPMADVDHINRKQKDNRICNLRLSTYSQNGHNTLKTRKRKRQAPRGVLVLYKKNKTYYYATICVNRKQINLGRFATAEEAGKAYQRAHRKILREFSPYVV